jgi:hypothetical protein
VQCWHERTVARIADEMAEELFAELDPVFLRWFYGRMGVDPELLAREIRAGRIQIPKRTSDAASVGMVARRKTQDGKRALPLVR